MASNPRGEDDAQSKFTTAWAVQVMPNALGTALEAYKNALPRITTLRACYQSGKTYLSRLPVALFEMVESAIIAAYRHDCSFEWFNRGYCLGWNRDDDRWLSHDLWHLQRLGSTRDVLSKKEFRCPYCSERSCDTCLRIMADPDAINHMKDRHYEEALISFFDFLRDADQWEAYHHHFVDEHAARPDDETLFPADVLDIFGVKLFTITDDALSHHDSAKTLFFLIPREATVFSAREIDGMENYGPSFRRAALGSAEISLSSESSFKNRILRIRRVLNIAFMDASTQRLFGRASEVRPRSMTLLASRRQEVP